MSDNEIPFMVSQSDSIDLGEDFPFVSSIKKAKKIQTTKKTKNPDSKKRKKKEIQDTKSKKKKEDKKNKEDSLKYEKYYNTGDYSKYPLYATTVCGVNIKKVIEIITPLTPDAVLRFSPEGLSIFGMEQVRMAILSTHFEIGLFHPFKCDQVFEIGIDTQHLSRILQHVPK